MSLYEQFHSDINKNYMFDMIKDIISKEMSLRVPSHKKWQKIKFDNVEVEKLIGDSNYRADLICEKTAFN